MLRNEASQVKQTILIRRFCLSGVFANGLSFLMLHRVSRKCLSIQVYSVKTPLRHNIGVRAKAGRGKILFRVCGTIGRLIKTPGKCRRPAGHIYHYDNELLPAAVYFVSLQNGSRVQDMLIVQTGQGNIFM